jgi:LacI family transcriptional regulator
MSGKRRATLSDIAERVGVSIATVSLALKEHPRISEATRTRVRAVADELGYQPDPALGALAAYRNHTTVDRGVVVGVLIEESMRDKWNKSRNRMAVHEGVKERADAYGYKLELFYYSDHDREQESLGRVLISRGIRSLLIAPRTYNRQRHSIAMPWQNFAAVSILNVRPEGPFHCSIPDFRENSRLLLKSLLNRGIRSVGLYISDTFQEWTRESAFHTQYALHPGWKDFIAEVPPMIGPENAREPFVNWYQKYRPEVVITHLNLAEPFLRDAGVSVPEECGIVYLDTRDYPERSGINVNDIQIGRNAMDLLHSQTVAFHFGLSPNPLRVSQFGFWNEGLSLSRPQVP